MHASGSREPIEHLIIQVSPQVIYAHTVPKITTVIAAIRSFRFGVSVAYSPSSFIVLLGCRTVQDLMGHTDVSKAESQTSWSGP
jgi:hypothetical protein